MVVIFGESGVNILDLKMEQYNSLFFAIGDQIRFAESLLSLDDENLGKSIQLLDGTGPHQAREQITAQVDHLKEFLSEMEKANTKSLKVDG